MKTPDGFRRVGNRNLEECAAECRRNCSCVAYAYADLRMSGGASAGDATRCLVWAGELTDTVKMGDVTGSDTLYLRIAGLRAGVWRRFYFSWGSVKFVIGVFEIRNFSIHFVSRKTWSIFVSWPLHERKLHWLWTGERAKTNALKIALPAVLASCLLLLAGISLARFKFKGTLIGYDTATPPPSYSLVLQWRTINWLRYCGCR